MIGEPGEGWALAMTVVSHEREPGELGYVARYRKTVKQLAAQVRADPDALRRRTASATLGWAIVETEMLRLHVRRRLSDRLDGITHGPEGSIDKLLMTEVEQAVGHAALAIGGVATAATATNLAQGVPLQPGPERHGRNVADPEATSSPAASSGCRHHERVRRARRDPDRGGWPRPHRAAQPTRTS